MGISPEQPQSEDKVSINIDGIPQITDPLYCFVQRLIEPESKRILFYVASLSEHGTKSAAFFLATQWKMLYRKYKNNQPFIIMLRVNPNDYKRWEIIFEKKFSI